MKTILILLSASLIFAQNNVEQALNNIFPTNANGTFGGFLEGYEEVTQPALKSIGALDKCGEGEQRNRFVCVPYFNCDPNTQTVVANPNLDGTNNIDVRFGDDNPACAHYLEVCCKVANTSTGVSTPTTSTTATPVATTPNSGNAGNEKQRVFCGMRNAQGLDFNLIGGTNEAKFGEFPWMVAILRSNPGPGEKLGVCGGSLIGPRLVLTGAHCVQNLDVSRIKVRAGEWDTQTQNERIPYQERNVAQKIIHEHFTGGNLYNNVALLVLEKSFAKTDSVGTICLPGQNLKFNSGECFATGWGKDIFGEQGNYAVILKKIQLPLVQHKSCESALRRTRLGDSFILHRSFICAGGENGVDTCTGDGGSPLVCPDPNNPNKYIQMGIVAWGIGCGENQVPGVYADVAQFRLWIDEKVEELGISSNSYML